MRAPRFKTVAAVQAALILAGACAWFYFVTRDFLAAPPPDADAYTLSWGFYVMLFVVLGLPLTLGAICLLIGAEDFARTLYYRRTAAHGRATERLPTPPDIAPTGRPKTDPRPWWYVWLFRAAAYYVLSVFAAFVTPTPDVLTMCSIWLPSLVLFEVGRVVYCRYG